MSPSARISEIRHERTRASRSTPPARRHRPCSPGFGIAGWSAARATSANRPRTPAARAGTPRPTADLSSASTRQDPASSPARLQFAHVRLPFRLAVDKRPLRGMPLSGPERYTASQSIAPNRRPARLAYRPNRGSDASRRGGSRDAARNDPDRGTGHGARLGAAALPRRHRRPPIRPRHGRCRRPRPATGRRSATIPAAAGIRQAR